MSTRYFGTDGIRGPADGPLLATPQVRRYGAALGRFLQAQRPRKSLHAVIGRDTRASGERIALALMEGLAHAGVKIFDGQIAPTPAIALATRDLLADLGIMITASHNPATDNGIKLFNAEGEKLTPAQLATIEQLIEAEPEVPSTPLPPSFLYDARRHYRQFVEDTLPEGALVGLRLVVDAAHGATFQTTPQVLRNLGAQVMSLGVDPDGANINAGVGSEHPAALAEEVEALGADLGLAHDGDGDRLVVVDELGETLAGEQVLGLLALAWQAAGRLEPAIVVTTVMSNLGLDAALKATGIEVIRTPVGDQHVIVAMRESGAILGGESSGHYIIGDRLSTGDGLLAALALLQAARSLDGRLSQLKQRIPLFAQRTANLAIREKVPFDQLPGWAEALFAIEAKMGNAGRILVRYSGTEPKIRLLAEAPDANRAQATLADLRALVETHLELA